MKFRSRFFIIFFFFAIFFSFMSYLAQNSLFSYNNSKDELRINQEISTIQGYLKNDPGKIRRYLRKNNIQLEEISYDKKINITSFNSNTTALSKYILLDYQSKKDIEDSCKIINSTDKNIIRQKPRDNVENYIIQSFCFDNKVYVVTSNFVQYDAAITLLRQSYLLILASTMIVSAIISFILSNYISNPITQMSFVTKKISNLDFNYKMTKNGNSELDELATNINILSDKFQHSIEQLKRSVIIEKESRERQIQLFASMSHELKTPITILKGTLEGIKDQVGPYKEPLNFVDDMIEETNTMETIVLNLLSYAKFSVNDIKMKFQPYPLEELINDTVERLDYLIKERQIVLEKHVVDDLVEVDFQSISMVFKNILENAVFYSDEKAKVEIFTSSFTDYVLIQIYNHGTNINQNSIIHIFEPFYRDESSRIQYKNGTGLGLTIVKQILDQHNSNFSLYNINNDEEYAVCFEFTLKKAPKKAN